MKILFKKRESPSRACEGTYISYVWAREGVGGGQHLASSPLGKSGGYRPGGNDPPPKSRSALCGGSFLPRPGTDGFQVFVTEILGWL